MGIFDRPIDSVQGRTLALGELAQLLGVSREAVGEWLKDGLPYRSREGIGGEHAIDSAQAVQWIFARESARRYGESAVQRLARAKAEEVELRLALKRNDLVPFAQIEPAWRTRCLTAAAFLSGQPSRLAGVLETTAGIEAKREVLTQVFREFLHHISGNGEAMQEALDELLQELGEARMTEFIARLCAGAPGWTAA